MGQDQSTQGGGGGTIKANNTSTNQQQHVDPSNRSNINQTQQQQREQSSSPRPNRQQNHVTSSGTENQNQQDPNNFIPKEFQNDDEVLAIWRQLESIQLPYPIIHSTGMNPDQEVAFLEQQLVAIYGNHNNNNKENGKDKDQQQKNDGTTRDSSPTLESISKYISELKRKAQSASKDLMVNAPNYRDRTAEIKNRLQKPPGATTTPAASPAPSTTASRAASPEASLNNTTTAAAAAVSENQNQNQQQVPLPTISAGPLLQALGRPQTLCLKEIANTSVPRCEKMMQDSVKLYQELQGLKSGALQQIRHGQKCYSVETEVKRLHLELHGDERGSATAKSIGHDGPFPSLLQVCDDTADLLDKIHNLLGEEPRKKLQEYAAGIDARSLLKSPVNSPVKAPRRKF